MTIAAIIVAAGSGSRAGGDIPKQYRHIGGKPVVRHTVEIFARHPAIDQIVVVISDEHRALCDDALAGCDVRIVTGSSTRQLSVLDGLAALKQTPPAKVLIHDAARPFVTARIISDVISALADNIGAIPVLPVVDTIIEVNANVRTRSHDRTALRAVQTPQGFEFDKIYYMHAKAADQGYDSAGDDAEFISPTVTVPGDPANIKLTTASDIAKADFQMTTSALAALPDIRTGQGFDVHAFEPGSHVILCGVKIPHNASLKGHSDADVAMHALTDAILGAIGKGDIGAHFPPSDEQWKAADSAIFLKAAAGLVTARAGMIAHCDITIICEMPKIGPHVQAMRDCLAGITGMAPDRISIKATTSEGLGFTGRSEGIAALATATVRLPG